MNRPNIIWFLVDQLRTQSLGVAGDVDARTPTIDRMAREGTWFINALSGCPLCSPARGSFLTSRYPHECVPYLNYCIPADQPLISEILQDAGYRTAWFGKWHVDHHEGKVRQARHTHHRLQAQLARWIERTGDSFPLPALESLRS